MRQKCIYFLGSWCTTQLYVRDDMKSKLTQFTYSINVFGVVNDSLIHVIKKMFYHFSSDCNNRIHMCIKSSQIFCFSIKTGWESFGTSRFNQILIQGVTIPKRFLKYLTKNWSSSDRQINYTDSDSEKIATTKYKLNLYVGTVNHVTFVIIQNQNFCLI